MVIGIIGGVGTGKSQIAEFIKSNYNAYIINADQVGHHIIRKGTTGYRQVVECFGNQILDNTGHIQRKILGDIVFNDATSLEVLNKITHPLIYEEIVNLILQAKTNHQYDFIVFEAAIMVEAMWTHLVDQIWFITCSKEIRIQRLMESRKLSVEKIENIISKQQGEEELQKYADVIIDNSFDFEITIQQVRKEIMKAMEAKHEKK